MFFFATSNSTHTIHSLFFYCSTTSELNSFYCFHYDNVNSHNDVQMAWDMTICHSPETFVYINALIRRDKMCDMQQQPNSL